MEHHPRLICSKCEFIFYQNSKPCVGGIILKGNEILLTQRGIEPYKGYWDVPGGFLELGEHPEDGVKRELHEELGMRCKIKKLFGMFMDTYGPSGDWILNIYYIVEPTTKIKGATDDIVDYGFFPFNKLPRKIAFPAARQVLNLLKRAASD